MALLSQKVSADAVAQRARAADAANRADEAIRLGYEATMARMDDIKRMQSVLA